MTTFQLECFLKVADTLSFTEAAAQLFVAQSSLSRNISNLETELNMELFIRTKKYVRLTPAGAVLYDEFSKLKQLHLRALEKARNAEKGEHGELTIGVLETQRSETFLPAAIQTLRTHHPNIHFDIARGTFLELRNAILNGELDLAITLDFDLLDYPEEEIVSQIVFQSAPKCVLATTHPLAQNRSIQLETLQTETMIAISPEVSRGGYQNILQFCERHDFQPAKTIFANSIQNVLLKVEAGLGFSVLDENCISNENTAVLSLPFYKTPPLTLIAVWRKDNLNPVIPLFTTILCSQNMVED